MCVHLRFPHPWRRGKVLVVSLPAALDPRRRRCRRSNCDGVRRRSRVGRRSRPGGPPAHGHDRARGPRRLGPEHHLLHAVRGEQAGRIPPAGYSPF